MAQWREWGTDEHDGTGVHQRMTHSWQDLTEKASQLHRHQDMLDGTSSSLDASEQALQKPPEQGELPQCACAF